MAHLLYFAKLMDQLGTGSEDITLPAEVRDVRALLTRLRGRGGAWDRALANPALTITVNKQFANLDTPVNDTSEIAFISMKP
jgi:molybdopterin synthase sulfur carrier subunit